VTWDEHCDVLVAGSGAGGLTGAYTAARGGLRVILAEGADRFGGTSAYSGGGMWFPCNAALKREGDDDTLEDAREYFRAVVGERTPRALQDAFLETGAQLIDYLEQDPDFAFLVYPWPDYYGAAPKARAGGRHIAPAPLPAAALGAWRARMRRTVAEERADAPAPEMLEAGQALVGRFLLALGRRPNVDLRLESELVELIRDQGAITGAVLRTPAGPRRVRAERGVILAAGGFERSAELRERFRTPGSVAGTMGSPGNTGRALLAALAVGADIDLMDQAWWSPGLLRPDGTATFTLGFSGGIFVDQSGRRFMNENQAYDRAGRAVIERLKDGRLTPPYWFIFDDRDGGRPPIQFPVAPIGEAEPYRAAGLWRTGASLEQLAEQIGVPPQGLVETVSAFNRMAEAGRDTAFGRGDEPFDRLFTGGPPLTPLTQPPFHAAAFGLSDLGTKGGLRTDARGRVLEPGGAPIPGLYAAGNTMAAVSGEAYPAGGNPIGASMVFAHLAARHLLAPDAEDDLVPALGGVSAD
jgi:3-oxosteroid 1-dehydrogenase